MKPIMALAGLLASMATAIAIDAGNTPVLGPRNSGSLADLPEPHDQVRLIHKHPTSGTQSTNSRRAETPSVQGGAILSAPRKKIQSVTGTFRVPEAKMPTEGPTGNNPVGVYAASFWVGIDGVTSTSTTTKKAASCDASAVSLRLGVDIFYDGTFGGQQTPFAWHQYLPRSATGFANFSVAAGDLVRLTASAASKGNGGTVTIENFGNVAQLKSKQAAVQVSTHTFDGSSQLPALCQAQAAWMVEDFPIAGLPDFPIALTNFTSVKFVKLGVRSGEGGDIGIGGARVVNVYQEPQGGRLTDCDVVARDGGKVVCKRVVGGV